MSEEPFERGSGSTSVAGALGIGADSETAFHDEEALREFSFEN